MLTGRRQFYQTGDLAGLGVPPQLGLFEDRPLIDHHFESSLARRNHDDISVGPALSELSRQTGGSWLVVSKCAVFDRDLHGSSSAIDVTQNDSIVSTGER
jgi:hypothetical protein